MILLQILHLAEDGCSFCAESKDTLINSKCQAPHIADLITGQFLPEQYKDIHELQGIMILFYLKAFSPSNFCQNNDFYILGLITNLEQMTQGVPQAQRVFNEIFFDSQLA